MDNTTKNALLKGKAQLTPEELGKRVALNKKILKFGCLPIVIIPIIIAILINIIPSPKPEPVSGEQRSQDSILSIKQMNTLVTALKSDSDYEIKDVYYNPKDSSLNIALTNKDNVIKDHWVNTGFFNDNYHLDSYGQIEGTYIFEYKKGKFLAHGDYKKPLTYDSRRLGRLTKSFKEKYYESYSKSFSPLSDYLKEHLNDPSSLEFDHSGCEPNQDGTFHCKAVFRAKNGFGALVLQTADCDIDTAGNVSHFRLNQ